LRASWGEPALIPATVPATGAPHLWLFVLTGQDQLSIYQEGTMNLNQFQEPDEFEDFVENGTRFFGSRKKEYRLNSKSLRQSWRKLRETPKSPDTPTRTTPRDMKSNG
jgi:hypothetical protein